MLKTLHGYLSWDLARTMLLALVAFTLVMTVFAVIEPMRKQGLDGTQVLSLFGYTIPVMLSLTMPIAALFASTFVYGRFSQDNELMACRASGIAAMTLLRPALVLGVMITAASLYLSNSVAPDLAERANQSIKNNVRGFAYSQLRQKGMVKHEAQILFADDVDEEHNTIYGMMLLDHKDPNDILIVMAPQTQLQFVQQDGEMYASVWMEDTVVARTGRYDVGRQSSAPIDSIPLRSPIKEDPSWYRWDRLRRTMANPAQNAEISRRFQRIRREIGQEMLAKEIMKAVQTGKAYDFKGPVNNSLTINAPIARRQGPVVELVGRQGDEYPIKAKAVDPGIGREIEAQSATIENVWSTRWNAPLVSVTFRNARTRMLEQSNPEGARNEWTARDIIQVGELQAPRRIVDAIESMDMNTLCFEPQKLTDDPTILRDVKSIRERDIRKLQGSILGEMHGRIAYGLSCFLLVASGAALGMLYRGGQILSAFALSVIPAAIVIVMVLMGKEMLSNPGVDRAYGLAAVWSGIVLLTLGNIALYARIIRR
ncbi:MAG: YjgP/YjgQ family permease [Planctomycetes bacterium]|nr:YjgP/YjgQ family permease [Planctomycetota bacterium]